jgi:GntR family transcriptional regulator
MSYQNVGILIHLLGSVKIFDRWFPGGGMPIDRIDRRSKLPYYQQLYEILRGRIARKEWKPGDMIPPESELIETYQVSRSTVRQVLDMLVNDGLIYRERGRGTFIAHLTLEQSMVRIVSFTEDMHQRGFTPGTRVLSARLVPASQDIAECLQVPAGEPLACVERLRLADGEPMSIEEAYLVNRYCPDILQHDFAHHPLRDILARDYNLRLVNAKQVIRAIPASPNLAKFLQIRPRSPLLFVERTSCSQNNIPLEFLRIYYRADRYSMFVELHE